MQKYLKSTTFIWIILHNDGPIMQINDLFYDCEAKSRPFGSGGVKWGENFIHDLVRDAWP